MSLLDQIPMPGPNAFMDQFNRSQQAGQALIQNPMRNAILAAQAQYAMPNAQVDNALSQNKLAQSNIDTQNYPEQARNSLLQNQLANQSSQYKNQLLSAQVPFASQIAQAKAMGASGLGVGGKEQMFFQNLVNSDNPQLQSNPDKINEATNAILAGKDALSDGTKLNVTPRIEGSRDRLTKYQTTSPLITQGVKAQQADAELKSLSNYTQPEMKEYGDTYAGISPSQIGDSFKSDDKSQTHLGRLIGAQALQYELAQIRVRMAQGEPSASATEELMGRSGQVIQQYYPKLSSKARLEAANYMDKGLEQALQARQAIGISPSQLNRYGNKDAQPLTLSKGQINKLKNIFPGSEGEDSGDKSDPLGIR